MFSRESKGNFGKKRVKKEAIKFSAYIISHESLVVSNPVKIAVDNYKITNIILSFSSWKYNTSRKIYASLRDKGFGGAVLMNLSMANNTLNHDLLTTKLHAYGHRMRYLNPIQDGLFWGCPSLKSVTQTWHSYTLFKKIQKIYESRDKLYCRCGHVT